MAAPKRYPAELRELAVWLVLESRDADGGRGGARGGSGANSCAGGHATRLGPSCRDRRGLRLGMITYDATRLAELEGIIVSYGGRTRSCGAPRLA